MKKSIVLSTKYTCGSRKDRRSNLYISRNENVNPSSLRLTYFACSLRDVSFVFLFGVAHAPGVVEPHSGEQRTRQDAQDEAVAATCSIW